MKRITQTFCLSAIVLFNAGQVGAAESISTRQELSDFTHNYYLNPRPELVESALQLVASTDLVEQASAKVPLRMMFSCIASRSEPSQRDQWRKLTDSMDGAAKEVLGGAFERTPAEILDEVPPSPARNDLNWACFFATGDHRYLNNVIGALGHLEERENMDLFLAAASAKWSLASNAKSHPQVKAALEAVKAGDAKRMGPVIDDILTKDPQQIGRETVRILREQKEKGVWNQGRS